MFSSTLTITCEPKQITSDAERLGDEPVYDGCQSWVKEPAGSNNSIVDNERAYQGYKLGALQRRVSATIARILHVHVAYTNSVVARFFVSGVARFYGSGVARVFESGLASFFGWGGGRPGRVVTTATRSRNF